MLKGWHEPPRPPRFPAPPALKRSGQEELGDQVIDAKGDHFRIQTLQGMPGRGIFEAAANGRRLIGSRDQLQWDSDRRAWRAIQGRLPYFYRP